MNREILFRGKRTDSKEWVYGFYYYSTRYGTHNIKVSLEDENSFVEYDVEVIPETVGQFTGLTDKNGDKIFEGDKLPGYENQGYCVVRYDKNTAGFVIYYYDYPISYGEGSQEVIGYELEVVDTESFSGLFLDEIEITGNIHDNG